MPIIVDIVGNNNHSGTYLGDIKEFLSAAEDLPTGWFSLSGEGYEITSYIGKQLLKVKNTVRWKRLESWWTSDDDIGMCIKLVDNLIYLPLWCHSDGRSPIMRPVNGTTRTVGSLEQDAIRNLTGEWSRGNVGPIGVASKYSYFTGVYKRGSISYSQMMAGTSPINAHLGNSIVLDASLQVPTASENRVLSRGTTIAINLND